LKTRKNTAKTKKISTKTQLKKTALKKTPAKKSKEEPALTERSCASCGKTAQKQEFLRFVADGEGKAVFDRKGRLPGRGMYICPERECLKAAVKKNLFAKGFKTKTDKPEYEELLNSISAVYFSYAFSLMKMGRGAGIFIGGSGKCEKALESALAKLVLVPEDASHDTVKKVLALAAAKNVPVTALPDRLTSALELDSPLRAAFAVTDEKLAVSVKDALERAEKFKSR
jgi:predicted RNA-binding protein YlxR (DUF448 family)/ribosomal protein L7Ae-like RNA K-turn-binding protein